MQINFQFTPAKQDYIKCTQAYTASIKGSLIVICVLLALQIYFGITAFDTPELETRSDWYTPLCLPSTLPLLALSTLFIWPVSVAIGIAVQIDGSPQLTTPTTWQMDENQIVVKNNFSETTSAWSCYQQAIEFDGYYLLVHAANKRMFNFVPKRAFDSPQTEAAFRALIEQHLGKLNNNLVRKIRTLILIASAGILLVFATAIAFCIPLLFQIMRYR